MKYNTLNSICNFVSEKRKTQNLTLNNYISTENMLQNKGGIAKSSGLPTTTQTQAFETGDILVSNIRPYFKKIWLADECGGCSNDVLVFRARENVSSEFLYYILSNDEFFDYATKTAKGTKMPRGDKKAIMLYEVPIINIQTQQSIANVLRKIDLKIELNNKINDNLEQQAQAIFKSWFVDFEPFGGVMPSDWEVGTFSKITDKTLGGDWGKDSPIANYTKHTFCIRGADIPDIKTGKKGKMPTRYILEKNFANKRLAEGDIVVEISGGSPTQSTGRVAVVSKGLLAYFNEEIICTNFCRALTPKLGYSMFMYHYWQYLYDLKVFFSYENGTTGIKNLDINGFLESEIINIPSLPKIKEFDTICQTIYHKIYSNGNETEKLTQLRDTLLPKLMSGEIDVSQVEI